MDREAKVPFMPMVHLTDDTMVDTGLEILPWGEVRRRAEPSGHLVVQLALDALDQCIEAWVHGRALTDDEGRRFTAALMAANRVVNGMRK